MIEEVTVTRYKAASGELYDTREQAVGRSLEFYITDSAEVANTAQTFAASLANNQEVRFDLFRRIKAYTGYAITEETRKSSVSSADQEEASIRRVWDAALAYCNQYSGGEQESNVTRVIGVVDAWGVEQLIRGIGKHLAVAVVEQPTPTKAEMHSKEYHVANMADAIERESVVNHPGLLAERLYNQGVRYVKPTA